MKTPAAFLLSVIVLAAPFLVASWADLGHITTAEVARRMLTKEQINAVNSLTYAYGDYFPSDVSHLPYCATFMDYVKRDTNIYDSMHFLNTPFIRDGEFEPFYPSPTNAVSALRETAQTLFFKKSKVAGVWSKSFSTLMLIHVVGDLHQPLHAASLLSKEYNFKPPGGDLGGNDYVIEYNTVGMKYKQLHLLYDCIGGDKCDYMPEVVTKEYETEISLYADGLMEEFPESSFDEKFLYNPDLFTDIDGFERAVKEWALESYEEAVVFYKMVPKMNVKLTQDFIVPLQKMLRRRIAIAGYRIGRLLREANKEHYGSEFQNLTILRASIVLLAMAFLVAITIACAYRKKYKQFSLMAGWENNGVLEA